MKSSNIGYTKFSSEKISTISTLNILLLLTTFYDCCIVDLVGMLILICIKFVVSSTKQKMMNNTNMS